MHLRQCAPAPKNNALNVRKRTDGGGMTIKTEMQLAQLKTMINVVLDQIHDEALAKFRTLARSTGQLTRIERIPS